MDKLDNSWFICEANEGAKIHKCKTKMQYKKFIKHLFKHHRLNQYKCTLEPCKHQKWYATKHDLARFHW